MTPAPPALRLRLHEDGLVLSFCCIHGSDLHSLRIRGGVGLSVIPVCSIFLGERLSKSRIKYYRTERSCHPNVWICVRVHIYIIRIRLFSESATVTEFRAKEEVWDPITNVE